MAQLYEKIDTNLNILFAPSIKRGMKVIEVPKELLKSIESGEDFTICGSETEEVVLCTKSQTFSVKRVEQSNSVFFVPPSHSTDYTIHGTCLNYYELRPTKGKVQKLQPLLTSLLSNPSTSSKYHVEERIRQEILASELEIQEFLSQLGVYYSDEDAQYKMLSTEEILDHYRLLLNDIIIHNLSIEVFPVQDYLTGSNSSSNSNSNSHNTVMTSSLLHFLLRRLSDPKTTSLDEYIKLDHTKIAKLSLQLVFQGKNTKKLAKEEFYSEWNIITPEFDKLIPTQDPTKTPLLATIFQGTILIVDVSKNEIFYHYLPKESLPSTVKERLTILYGIKKSFSTQELEPYFQDMIGTSTGQAKNIGELLLSHTKVVDGLYHMK